MPLGTFGKKIGMTQVFDDDGRVHPVTVVRVDPCPIVQVKSVDCDGYEAIQLAYGDHRDPKRANRPTTGHFKRAELEPTRRHLKEIRLDDASEYEVGQQIGIEIFTPGEKINIRGLSKGRGTAGVMKRHGFGGAHQMSHGTHEYFRHGGSIGCSTTPGRVWKGKKMPGRYGNATVTIRNLEIVRIDPDRNLLLLRGAIPGPSGGFVRLQKHG